VTEAVGYRGTLCECELRCRAWNPNTGRCEACGMTFEDLRADRRDRRLASATKEHAS